jgi:thiol-disulfide isomerase/thioredoxin
LIIKTVFVDRNKWGTGIVIIIALLVGIYVYQKYRVAPDIKFRNLELTDLFGKPVKLEDYKGKKLFLNFFATWCGPCRAEIPLLDKVADSLASENFVFISISDEPITLLTPFTGRVSAQHIIMLHSVKKLHELGVFTVPTNYILNDRGEVVFEKTGERSWTAVEISKLVK